MALEHESQRKADDRSRRCRFWHPHPVILAGVPKHRGGARGSRAQLHRRRDSGHVGAQTQRPASVRRHRLLLESGGSLPFHGRPFHSPMASEFSPFCSRYPVLWCRGGRPNGETSSLAAPCARNWHGPFVHPATYGLLRGQRTAPAALAFATTLGALAPSQPRWPSYSDMGTDTPSPHSAVPHPSYEGRHLTTACTLTHAGAARAGNVEREVAHRWTVPLTKQRAM